MAAVNLVAPLLLALGAVSTALGVGAASVISRSLGAGDPAGAGRAAGTTFTVFWAAAITTTVVGLVALDPLLRMLGAHGPTLDYARDYAVIILAGAIMSTGFSSLVRAEGRMRFSTMLWIIPVLVQITLDPLFIFVLDLGVRGAALGTVGGQAVSAAMSLWFFFLQRHRPYRVGLHDLRPRATVAGPLPRHRRPLVPRRVRRHAPRRGGQHQPVGVRRRDSPGRVRDLCPHPDLRRHAAARHQPRHAADRRLQRRPPSSTNQTCRRPPSMRCA